MGSGFTDLLRFDTSAADLSFSFEVGDGRGFEISAQFSSILSSASGLGAYSLTSASDSRAALAKAKNNIAKLAELRGAIGASGSRLGTASSLVGNQRSEFDSSASRILDVDVAEEAARLVRQQILSQVSSSLLAQANQQPAIALRILNNLR